MCLAGIEKIAIYGGLMNHKAIIKHFYEVVVSENLLDELPRYVSEDCTQRTGNVSAFIGIEGMDVKNIR